MHHLLGFRLSNVIIRSPNVGVIFNNSQILRFSEESRPLPILTLYTKNPCPLCDQAKAQLNPFRQRFRLKEVDITLDENQKWFGLYRYEIPVFYLEGKFLCKNRIDLDMLDSALKQLEV